MNRCQVQQYFWCSAENNDIRLISTMVMTMVTMMVSMVVAMMMSIGMNIDDNIGPSIVATIVVRSTEAGVIRLTDDHIWLLLDYCCLLDLLSLWVSVGSRLVVSHSRLVVSRWNSAWPHRLPHWIRLCGGCGRCSNALDLAIHVDWTLRNCHWWRNNHLIHNWLWSALFWMLDQGVELGDLILGLLIYGLRCEVAQDQGVSGVFILTQ